MTLQAIPYISLIWIGIGFLMVLIGIFTLAKQEAEKEDYTNYEPTATKEIEQMQEMFSYFLEEEEKKNDALRQSLKKEKEVHKKNPVQSNIGQENYGEIIKLYEQGLTTEEIAKQLNMGKGEVSLMLSLYAMR